MTTATHQVVSQSEWLERRKELLKEEKELTRRRDELSEKRRELPWVKVAKNYVFDGADGPVALADLFDGRSQLLIYHFMFAPEWSQGCKSCSFVADNFNPSIIHLQHRDTTLAVVSRAPIDKVQAFRQRMGWDFNWVSSYHNDFNKDYGVYFTDEERNSGLAIYNYVSGPYPISDLPGMSVFARDDAGNVFHTYSTYARGLDIFLNTYNLLDITPKGRDEAGMTNMDWLRHHDRYDDPNFVDPWLEKQATCAKV